MYPQTRGGGTRRAGTEKRVRLPQQQQQERRRQWHWRRKWIVRPILQQTRGSGRYPQPQQRQRGTRPGKLLRLLGQGPRQTDTFAAYIASLSEEDNAAANYCKYISCRLGKLSVPALLDSGNVWQKVMSEQLLKKLGIGPEDLQPLSISKIQTATMGASLEIMGELKQRIYLQLGGCETRFRCRPVMVRGLTHDLNLSGPFLRQNTAGNCNVLVKSQLP
jgi:hypothetical protein